MARIFNIYFRYNDSTYNAVVSVRSTPFFIEYTLNNLGEELIQLLPGNKIVSRGPQDFIFQDAAPGHSTDLMNAIIRAVAEHLHASKADHR
jgi:hypothetical protein